MAVATFTASPGLLEAPWNKNFIGGNPFPGSQPTPSAPKQPVYNPLTNRYDEVSMGTPRWDAERGLFVVGTQPFTGTFNGETYQAGKSSMQIANDPASRYAALNTVKNPAVAGATDNLLSAFKSSPEITDFSSLLDASKLGKSLLTEGVTSDKAAYDIGDLSSTLDGLNKKLADTHTALDSRYSSILGGVAGGENAIVDAAYGATPGQFGRLQGINDTFAGTGTELDNRYSALLDSLTGKESGIVQRANDLLPQYDQAANNIGDRQTGELIKQLSRYKLGGGTPTSLGSGEERMLMRGVADVRLPLEQQKIQRRYDLLTGLELPIAQGDTARRVGQIQNFSLPLADKIHSYDYNTAAAENSRYNEILQNLQLPLLQGQGQRELGQLTGFTAPNAQQDYQNDFNTATLVKNLQLQTAGKSLEEAVQYMRAMAIPEQLMQQILQGNQTLRAGDISNLSGLSNLFSGSRYQGLQDKLGTNVAQPQNYTFQAPNNTSAPSRYTPTYENPQTPVQSTPAPSRYPVTDPTPASFNPAAIPNFISSLLSNPLQYAKPYSAPNPAVQDMLSQFGMELGLNLGMGAM